MDRWAEIGRGLLRAGLAERAVFACFGVSAIAHVPRAIAAGRSFDEHPPVAAVAPWLLVGGGTVDAGLARKVLGGALDGLEAAGLVENDGAVVRSSFVIAPAGGAGALAVSDPPGGAVPPPDDSSHHLVAALPERRVGRWLDVGTGNGWAPLAAAGRAGEVVAADISARAMDLARTGVSLSGIDPRTIDLRVADLAAGIPGTFDLVTFNAPIPADRAHPELLDRFWRDVPALVAPGGEVIVHSIELDPPDLPGELVIARYTPAGVAAFAITAWRPGGPPGRRVVEIALTAAAPHVPRSLIC